MFQLFVGCTVATAILTVAMVGLAAGPFDLVLLVVAAALNISLLAINTLVSSAIWRSGLDQTWGQALAGIAIAVGGTAGFLAAGAITSLDVRLIAAAIVTVMVGGFGGYVARRDVLLTRSRALRLQTSAGS